MHKLLALLPNSKAAVSSPILATLLALGGYIVSLDGMDPNVKGVLIVLIVIAVLGVHFSGIKSNADGTDAKDAYKAK